MESRLPVVVTRARLRSCAATPYVADLAAFRRRQIIGWRLSESNESVLFQPEYGDTLDIDGARFVGLVEPVGAGSRIRGRILASPSTRLVLSLWMVAVVAATFAALAQGRESPGRLLEIGAVLFGAAVIMVRYRLWSARRIVEARLRERLDASGAVAA